MLTAATCLAFVGAAGCDDFATPAELDRPQILAMAATPPSVPLGGTTQMSVLVAGPDGEVVDPVVEWDVVAVNAGLPALGRMDPSAATPTFVAPDQVPDEPTIGMVQASVTTSAGVLLGQKAVVIGPLLLTNPVLATFEAGGTNLLTDELRLAPGAAVTLDVAIEPEADKDTTYSWYSTVGSIEAYRSAPTEFVAPETAETGWLFVVVRDSRGGIVWHKTRVVIE